MKNYLTTALALTTLTFSISSSLAEKLPAINVKDWLSYNTISIGKNHGVGVNLEGGIHFYFMNRDERLNLRKPVELKIRVERRSKKKGSKWSTKRVTVDGFTNPTKPSENPETLTINGVVTGEVEFKIDMSFSKEGVLMKAAFGAKPKDADDADYRLSVVSGIAEMYSVSATAKDEEKDIKGKTRGSSLEIETRKGKAEKVRFYEAMDVEQLEKDEITSIELKTEKIGRKKLYWSLANPKQGSIQIEPNADSKMPYDGFKISTLLIDETGQKHSEGLLLEYK